MQYHRWVIRCPNCGKPQVPVNVFFTHSDTIMVETVCVKCAIVENHDVSVFDMMAAVLQQEKGDIELQECFSHAVN